jgi:hypothetical protein
MARQPPASDAWTPSRLRLVLPDLGGLALGVLHHGVKLGPSQKARTQRLILDALCQLPDDPGCLPKRGACLPLLAPGLIQACHRRLDLPLFCWQAELCCRPCSLAQVADGLLAVSLPRGEQSLRLQGGKAVARGRPQTFPSRCTSARAWLSSPTQQGLRFILTGEIQQECCPIQALADGEGLHGRRVGLFPLPGHGAVHAQLRQADHAPSSQVNPLSHGFCLFKRAARLFPLLQGVRRPAQGKEKASTASQK